MIATPPCRCAPRNDGVWHKINRGEAITGMAGLRRRCAPRNDGAGAGLLGLAQ
ncbi:MAG: hypothetical protein HON55_00710 [Legionellales bacterium]|nr:hypothetical protein [Legionellales bacterium]